METRLQSERGFQGFILADRAGFGVCPSGGCLTAQKAGHKYAAVGPVCRAAGLGFPKQAAGPLKVTTSAAWSALLTPLSFGVWGTESGSAVIRQGVQEPGHLVGRPVMGNIHDGRLHE